MWPNLESGLSRKIFRLALHTPWLNGAMEFLAQYLIFVVPVVLVIVWLRRDGLRVVSAATAGAALAVGGAALIGDAWRRPRPFVMYHFSPLISHAADSSFPSDHLAVLGAVGVAVALAARRLGLVILAAALLVAFSRVYVGVHYVSDVVDGAALGAVCGGFTWYLTRLAGSSVAAVDVVLQRLHLRPRDAVDSS